MNRLWIFGDSFSFYFKFICPEYHKEFKYEPTIFSQNLSGDLNLELKTLARGGNDNYTIFNSWINVLSEIKKEDILIFGWSQIERFRLADVDNEWLNINIRHFERKKQIRHIENFSKSTLDEILINRNNEKYFDEVNNFIKIINFTMKDNIIIHWSWINFENKINLTLEYEQLDNIATETKGKINNGHYGQKSHKILSEIMKMEIYKSGKYNNKIYNKLI